MEKEKSAFSITGQERKYLGLNERELQEGLEGIDYVTNLLRILDFDKEQGSTLRRILSSLENLASKALNETRQKPKSNPPENG